MKRFYISFIIRDVNSDMPIYINRTNTGKKIKCPERDSNPRHPDLMKGALITELPRLEDIFELGHSIKSTVFDFFRNFRTFIPESTLIQDWLGPHKSEYSVSTLYWVQKFETKIMFSFCNGRIRKVNVSSSSHFSVLCMVSWYYANVQCSQSRTIMLKRRRCYSPLWWHNTYNIFP